jgi:hypothetical protein
MYGLDSTDIILSIIFTWIVGLLPPLLIRYVLLKQPITKWPAIVICVFFWLCNFVLFTSLGSKSKTHAALYLVAWVSYLILRRENKTLTTQPIQVEAELSSIPTPPTESATTHELEASIDARLSELKSLYEKGLIANEVYLERQKEILRGK